MIPRARPSSRPARRAKVGKYTLSHLLREGTLSSLYLAGLVT